MPFIVSLLAHPERRRPSPPPLRADLTRIVVVGMVAWGVALVITLVLLATGAGSLLAVLTCGTGLLLGGVGLLWARRHRDDGLDEQPAAPSTVARGEDAAPSPGATAPGATAPTGDTTSSPDSESRA